MKIVFNSQVVNIVMAVCNRRISVYSTLSLPHLPFNDPGNQPHIFFSSILVFENGKFTYNKKITNNNTVWLYASGYQPKKCKLYFFDAAMMSDMI